MIKNVRVFLLALPILLVIVGCQEQIASPEKTLQEFSALWEEEKYHEMFPFLSEQAMAFISEEEFVEMYSNTYKEDP